MLPPHLGVLEECLLFDLISNTASAQIPPTQQSGNPKEVTQQNVYLEESNPVSWVAVYVSPERNAVPLTVFTASITKNL